MSYKSKFTGEQVDEYLSRVEEAGNLLDIKNKADKEGYYPSFTAGFADQLSGHGESTPEEFSFRATGGRSILDGVARIKTLRGNGVVWNQKVPKQYIAEDRAITLQSGESLIQGHKYLIARTASKGACFVIPAKDVYLYYLNDGESARIFTSAYNATSNGIYPAYPHVYCTSESGYVQLIDLTMMFGVGNEPTTIEEYNARKPIVADEYAYNEGEVIAFNGEAIKSVGDNAWDEQWESGGIYESSGVEFDSGYYLRSKYIRVLPNTQYYFKKPKGIVTYLYFYDNEDKFVGWLDPFATSGEGGQFTTLNASYMRFTCLQNTYNNDIMITLVHSGWKVDTDAGYQPYWNDVLQIDSRIRAAFPNGMHKWDKVYNKGGKGYVIKGTGAVDLSSLLWALDARYNNPQFYAEVPNKAVNNNAVCAKYITLEYGGWDTNEDKTIVCSKTDTYVIIVDAAYKSVEDFKEAMSGVMLYYELAEPTIIEYDQPFNFDYRVADFGTEEIISDKPTAPLKADIIYQFNAVDMIRDLWARVQALEGRL